MFSQSVQSLSQTDCDPVDCRMPGFPVPLQLPELAQTHVHPVRDANQRSHPLLPLLLPSIFPSIRVFSNQLFTLGGQSIGVSASASVLPMNIQNLFPSGWTGLISLQSKGLSRIFFKTTDQKHQFFSAQTSKW